MPLVLTCRIKGKTGEMYFYYFPKGIIKKKAVNGYEIPNVFNIDEDEYSKLIADLYTIIKRLRTVWFQKTREKLDEFNHFD